MPIYEYRCKKCGAEFEQVRPRAEMDRRRSCPSCRSRATERKAITRFAFAGASDAGVAAAFEQAQSADDPDAMTVEDFYHDP